MATTPPATNGSCRVVGHRNPRRARARSMAVHGLFGAAALLACAAAGAQIQPLSVLAQRGGPLQLGTYACKQQYNRAGYTYKVVEFTSPTQYAWVAGGSKPGAMRYDPATGRIVFTSGPLGKGFEAHAGRRADGAPVVILVDTDLAPKADAYDYCVPRKK